MQLWNKLDQVRLSVRVLSDPASRVEELEIDTRSRQTNGYKHSMFRVTANHAGCGV